MVLLDKESPAWYGALATTLAAIPVSFVTLESLNKKWKKKEEQPEEKGE